jgi:hypothetical protein
MTRASLDGELMLVTGGGQGLGAPTSRVLVMVMPTQETSWT